MLRALIVSENSMLARFFELELESCGYLSDTVRAVGDSLEKYDLLILDIDTAPSLRDDEFSIPTVKISSTYSLASEREKHLPWPASISDIRKICALDVSDLTDRIADAEHILSDTVYVVDKEKFIVSVGDRYVRLTRSEFAILCCLCQANGRHVDRKQIMELLGADSGNIAEVYVCHLRKKLEANSGKRLIFTQRGKGYRTSLKMI